MTELSGIINTLKDTYNGSAWHGSSVKEALSKIPDENFDSRIGKAHSISELILHMAAWRNFVIQKLQGNDAYEVTDEANFPSSVSLREALIQLDKSQDQLLAAIADFDEQKLHNQVPLQKYSFYKLLHGVVHHDLYHLGQIVMITKQF